MNQLFFEKYANFRRSNEPVQATLPFKKGQVFSKDLDGFLVKNSSGRAVSQTKALGFWDDGSIKWLKVNFLADIPANAATAYEYGFEATNAQEAPPALKITLESDGEAIAVDNGCLRAVLNNRAGLPLFHSFQHGLFEIGPEQIDGPYVDGGQGKCAAVLTAPWETEENGGVLLKLTANGRHWQGLDFKVTLLVYAETPWIEIKYKIINRSLQDITLKKIAMDFSMKGENPRWALATSNYKSNIRESSDEPLDFMIDADYLLYDENEQIPEVFYGTFFTDWCEPSQGGLCVTQYQAYQNFPKAFSVSCDMLSVRILPEEYGGLPLYRGMAKTHSMFLHFHSPDEPMDSLNKRSLILQSMDLPTLSAKTYEESGIFSHLFVDKPILQAESALIRAADNRGKAYGILHWGDYPDAGYTHQGRGGGEPVWTNNEYDFPYAAFQLYVRKPERRFLDYMLTTAAHWADTDVCHFDPDPLRMGAQIIHSARHTSGYVEISHEWVEGLFAYYYMTGDRFVYDTAIGIGNNIVTHLEQPRYRQKGEINARETGWALRALVALYKETNDAYWLEKADFIISHFEDWAETYGGWFAPYTDHTVIRVPFMISIAAGSLMRYYRVKPQEKIRAMILSAVDDLLENCVMENGLFFYKELPSLRRQWGNTLILEALAYAYELTGDVEYLEAGLPTFRLYLSAGASKTDGVKRKAAHGVLLEGTGPKTFAQSFFPIMSYYYSISKAGIYSSHFETGTM